jgi:hypothetical protein
LGIVSTSVNNEELAARRSGVFVADSLAILAQNQFS